MNNLFYPNRNTALDLEQKMSNRLADSLAYMAEACADDITLPEEEWAAKLNEIREKRVSPETFSRHYQLIPALEAGDEKRVRSLFQEILESESAPERIEIFPLTDPAGDARARNYFWAISPERENSVLVQPLDQNRFDHFESQMRQALKIINTIIPELAQEIDVLVKTIVLGSGKNEDGSASFGNVSAAEVFGSIITNSDASPNLYAALETIVHEEVHILLFGYCSGSEKLVNNPEDERYRSPLRKDLRPLDGIFHATFVLARIHLMLKSLPKVDLPEALPSEGIEARIAFVKERFDMGLDVLNTNANFTPQGRKILDAAAAYMGA
jgi:HEXXH motif-containing protein